MLERKSFLGGACSERDEKIDALARAMLKQAHEQGLRIGDIRTAYNRCEAFVLNKVVPIDEENEVSLYVGNLRSI